MPEITCTALTKLYYSIGEVAKMFEVNPSLLRYWEKEFDLVVTKKNAKGNRQYSVKEIEYLNKIYHLVKTKGFTHEGAKNQLKQKRVAPTPENPDQEIILILEKIRTRLRAIKTS